MPIPQERNSQNNQQGREQSKYPRQGSSSQQNPGLNEEDKNRQAGKGREDNEDELEENAKKKAPYQSGSRASNN